MFRAFGLGLVKVGIRAAFAGMVVCGPAESQPTQGLAWTFVAPEPLKSPTGSAGGKPRS